MSPTELVENLLSSGADGLLCFRLEPLAGAVADTGDMVASGDLARIGEADGHGLPGSVTGLAGAVGGDHVNTLQGVIEVVVTVDGGDRHVVLPQLGCQTLGAVEVTRDDENVAHVLSFR